MRVLTGAAGVLLAASGVVHAQLYVDGYRYVHVVGVLFVVQAAASFGLAALLLAGGFLRPPALVHLAATGTALGALAGFAASRTVGVFGFTERGLQPAPQALVSILAEAATVLALLTAGYVTVRRGKVQVGA
ncbi:hypothetical protein DN069_02405 [Streptacidiphilus pinicola]|uniref:DUF4383 domain-containing protein n=1 Tax=Streptacidiphilus pinicola TaxID=2219663 RepID=A0A2X0IV13_9ACTN|nr:hypothetical protein DN069_02405 [Streptacidiphilus pinicola]